MKDLHPVLVSAYSTYPHQTAKQLEEAGEWPKEGVHYYGFPQFPDTYVTYYRKDLFCNEKEAAKFQATFNQKLPCTYAGLAAGRLGRLGEHRQALPAQEGRPARRRRGGRRFLRHRLSGRRRLRLLDHAGERLHLAARRLDLGRDQGARRPGARRRELGHQRQGVRAVSEHAALHAAGGEDRPDGHLRGPGPVHAGQGRGGDRLGRPGRAGARSEDLQGLRQVRVRRGARAPRRPTAPSTAPAISAASPSC